MTNLKELSKKDLEDFIKSQGLPPYRARQMLHWIYEKRAQSIEQITELSKDLRERLSQVSYIGNLILTDRKTSADGTEKFLFGLEDGNSIESVLISDDERLTLCVSSQVGCAMSCRFCLTGRLKLKRNLKAHEIVDQIISAQRLIVPMRITNIVFMGMGEPLHNLDEVSEAIRRTVNLIKISRRRITVSTAGIAPKIMELAEKAPCVNLAVSLNATTDEARSRIMPINKKYPIKTVIDALKKFPLPKRSRITFEYVMMAGINDAVDDALRLAFLIKGIPSKINLIPLNEFEGCEFKRPDDEVILRFQKVLIDKGVTALIRKSKGADILAACGQLRAAYYSL